jgi:hypothetical protein
MDCKNKDKVRMTKVGFGASVSFNMACTRMRFTSSRPSCEGCQSVYSRTLLHS